MSELPKGWARTTLGDVCRIVSGSTPRSGEALYWGGEIPWITPDDLSKHTLKMIARGRRSLTAEGYASCSTQMVPSGSVLFTSRAPIGYVAIASQPVCTNQGFKSLVPPEGLMSDYLYWYMRYATDEIRSRASGTTFAEISGRAMAEVPLVLPPRQEQARIVAAIEEQFTQLGAGVAALERVRRNLKRARAAVLEAAVKGNLVEQDLKDESASTSIARVVARTRFKETLEPIKLDDLSSLPHGWAWARVGQLASRVTVGHVGPTQGRYLLDGVPFLRSQNVRPDNFDPAGLVRISPTFHRALAKSMIVPGDVVIVRSGVNRGAACVVPDQLGEANCADLVIVQRPSGIHPRFLSFFINSVAQGYVRTKQVGVAIPHFNTQSLSALPVPVPPLPEQLRIVERADRILSSVERLEEVVGQQVARSGRLHSSTLAAAFAGKLVPQDPYDQPASVLLERLATDRGSSNRSWATRVSKSRTTQAKVLV